MNQTKQSMSNLADTLNMPHRVSPQEMREAAEAAVTAADLDALAALTPDEIRAALYESQVHQIQLEMQTHEMRTIQEELEASRIAYSSLYEWAPVGYVTTDAGGSVLQCNLTAASLLGTTKGTLQGRHLSRFLLPADQDIFYLCHRQLVTTGSKQLCEVRMVRQGTDVFRAHLTMAIAPETDGETRCRVTISDVTTLREAQAGVRKSELWHEEFAAHMPLLMWTGLADGSCDFTTQQAAHYTGLSAEELMNWGFLQTVHPDDRAAIQAAFAAAAPARGGSFSVDARVRRHDGEYRWFTCMANAARNDEGVAIRWFGVNIDVHARVLAEQALRESERLFRNTFHKHSAVKFLIDHDTGTIIDANEAAANFYGWSREQLLQMRIQDINVLPPDQVQQEMAEARGRSKLEFEFRHRRADGSVRDVKVHSSSVTTDGKAVLHSIVHDVTEQREAEEALSQSEAWLRQLSESLPALVCTALPGGLIEYATQSTAEYTGIAREALLGVGYLEAIHPEDRDGLRAAFAASAETGSPLYAEIRLHRHDGEYRWFAALGNPVMDATGKAIRWFGINVDIHEAKATAAALRQHRQLLDTIRKTHDVYIGQSATDDALAQLLDGVLALTDSGMGFLAEVREPQPGAESQEPCLVWQAMGGPELARNADLAALAQRTAGAEFRTLENRLGACLRTEQVMIANDPSRDGHPLSLPPEHPPLRSFMGVPIRHAGAMVGMLGLANRDGGYDEDLVHFLEPLLVSCAAIFHDMRIEALEQKFLSQLLESESHYRTLFQTMAQGVIEYDRDGLVIAANPAAARMLGLAEGHLAKLRVDDPRWGIVDENRDPISPEQHPLRRALASAETVSPMLMGLVNPADQTLRWLLVSATPQFHSRGSAPHSVLVVMTDITPYRETELVLKQTRDRLSYAMEASTEGMWDWNIQSGEIILSDQWITSLGYTREEVDGDVRFRDAIVHPDDLHRAQTALQAHMEGHSPLYVCENRLRTKDGRYRDNLVQGKIVEWDQDGAPLRMVGTDVDITERNWTLNELRRLTDQLVISQEAESARIAAELHDEVGQTLTGLTLLLENAPGLSAAAFEERLELARQEASALLKTVRDMTMDLRPPLLQDFGLVEALKSHFRRYSLQTNLPVEFELTGEERQQPARMAITAYRIIQEALTNVARHASASRVAVTLSFDRHETKLQVVDDGCGFDVAERRDESNGLAGMLERARSVGGTVRLSSGSTSGTTISAVLPFVAATEGGN